MARIERYLSSPWLVWLAVLLPLALVVEVLGIGLLMDDYLHRAKLLDGFLPPTGYNAVEELFGGNPVFGLFRFMPGDPEANGELVRAGVLPWWSLPESKGAFCRPVSALTHWLDYALYPNQIVMHHIHSYLWAGLGVWVVSRLYIRHYGYGILSGIAILGFAFEDAHLIPTGWIANRNAWIALVFGALAILHHTKPGRGSRFLGPFFLFMALFSGEIGLCATAYLAAWELVVPTDGFAQRIKRLLPYGGVVVAWMLVYMLGDYGAYGSGLYIDPKAQPLQFALTLPGRLGLLVGSQATQVPSDVWMLAGSATAATAGIGFLVVVGLLLFLGRSFFLGTPLRRFWLLGTVLSLVPVAGVFPMDRVLMFAGIGFFALLGEAVVASGLFSPTQERSRPWSRRFVGFLVVIHIVAGGLSLPFRVGPSFMIFESADTIASAGFRDESVADEYVVVFNTVDVPHSFMSLSRLHRGLPIPRGSYQLGNLLSDFEIYRSSESVLEVTPEGGFLANDIDRMTRSVLHPFEVGYQRDAGLFQVTVLEITPDGRPGRVAFDFGEVLETLPIHWVSFRKGRLGPQPIPAVGERIDVSAPNLMQLQRLFTHPKKYVDLR